MKIAAIFVVCGILQFYLPWWTIVIVCFLMGLILAHQALEAFLIGFTSITILWAIACLVQSIPNEQILAVRVAQMFHLSHAWILTMLTSLLGGLVAGISGWCGYFCRICWFDAKKKKNFYD